MVGGKGIVRVLVCALLALTAAGCASWFAPAPPDFAKQMPALEARVYALAEEERLKLNPKAHKLVLDPELVAVARKRSAEMARLRSFTNGDPHASATLLMQQDAQFQGLVGENVAAQYFRPRLGIDVDKFARRFVDGWIASTPHRNNLTFTDYDHTGIGAAVNNDTVYITQLFTTDLGLMRGPKDTAGKKNAGKKEITPVSSSRQARREAKPAPLRGAILPKAPAQ